MDPHREFSTGAWQAGGRTCPGGSGRVAAQLPRPDVPLDNETSGASLRRTLRAPDYSRSSTCTSGTQ
jgi:hypothetical protein